MGGSKISRRGGVGGFRCVEGGGGGGGGKGAALLVLSNFS